ncbi:MAG: DUF3309 family protein [Reyranella sp.]|uniref:DUF3309 family protein n=1 Tax=Reyranella sp. TaxID=1929291 RepID=UPI00272F8368|nr:DUF3309 family protein [Reyranella sp.]MDP1967135.1 DUF3309 family protein [Reyranella sp.]MDP2372022.1 DUF3309 family protein [Reyranella sp.]
MLILGLTLLLTVIGIAVMPCWRYSTGWGYGPGACAGAFLICVGIFAASGRTGPSEALSERLAAHAKSALMVEASIIDLAPLSAVNSAME